ncbi:unnamed protein product [Parajaminaea phylloscopi]
MVHKKTRPTFANHISLHDSTPRHRPIHPRPRTSHTQRRQPAMAEKMREIVDIPQSFVREGTQFMNRCTKPSRKEYIQICRMVGMGFVVMGFIGYFVKLIHIPINNILVGGA